MLKSMIPYYILALAIILTFRLTAEVRFFADTVGRFWSIISPFLTGAIFAYILNLPCCALQRLIQKLDNSFINNQHKYVKVVTSFIVRKSRAFSVLLLFAIVIVIISLALNMLIPAIRDSFALFIGGIESYEATIREWIYNLNEMDMPEFISDLLNEETIITVFQSWFNNFDFSNVMSRILSGFGGVFHAFLAIISSIYLLIEKDKLKPFVIRLIEAVAPKSTNETILKYSRQLDYNFRQYIFAQTIDGIILGSIMTIVLLLFGSPFALLLGLILGVVNYIPYFGSIFGTAFAVLVIAFTQGLPTAAFAAVIMFAIQQFDGNFIQPKLMGKTFSLSPLLVIISVTIGLHYGGVLGMLVAIPIVAILKDLLDAYVLYKRETKNKPELEQDTDFMDRDIW